MENSLSKPISSCSAALKVICLVISFKVLSFLSRDPFSQALGGKPGQVNKKKSKTPVLQAWDDSFGFNIPTHLLRKTHWDLLCWNYLCFLSTYMMKDIILRFNTDVKNHIRTQIWLTACTSHKSCILLFSTVDSSFRDICQQRHFCPSWALTSVFFPSVPVIGSAYNSSWLQLDCIIWDFFSLSPTNSHGFTGKCYRAFIRKILCVSHLLGTQEVTALLAG